MSRRVITPEGVLSFPFLFAPRAAMPGEEPKYQAVICFPEGTDLSALRKAALEVATEAWGPEATKQIKAGKIRMPFREPEPDEDGTAWYPEGTTYMTCRSKSRPGVVDRYLDPETGKPRVIEDPDVMYPGCRVRFSVTFFSYDRNGNRGVGVALNNVQRMGDGPRLDSRVHAQDEFSGEAPPENLDWGGGDDGGVL
ncbi:MAG: DUF2815 family protein [Armatimonadota bacterium]|nr:DUF2815 family protein [Armatimonadota bacterium]